MEKPKLSAQGALLKERAATNDPQFPEEKTRFVERSGRRRTGAKKEEGKVRKKPDSSRRGAYAWVRKKGPFAREGTGGGDDLMGERSGNTCTHKKPLFMDIFSITRGRFPADWNRNEHGQMENWRQRGGKEDDPSVLHVGRKA